MLKNLSQYNGFLTIFTRNTLTSNAYAFFTFAYLLISIQLILFVLLDKSPNVSKKAKIIYLIMTILVPPSGFGYYYIQRERPIVKNEKKE